MKILLTGSIAIDRIMTFDGYFKDLIQPNKLHVLSVVPIVKEMRETRGGAAANIAYSLALLGEKSILYASVGRDARNYMKSLNKLGVDTAYLHYSKKRTASFSVLTDLNDCQVGGIYAGAMADAASLTFEHFANEDVFIVVSPHDPVMMIKQAQEAQQLKKRLLLDVGQQALILSGADLKKILNTAEVIILNDYEMGLVQKKTAWSIEEMMKKVKLCIVTLGGKGAIFYHRISKPSNQLSSQTEQLKKAAQSQVIKQAQVIKQTQVPAVKVKKILDPTGAGDAFRAGFLYGYLRDWPIKRAVRLGCVVASFVVEKLGTQEHHFSWQEIKSRYQQTYQSKLKI